MSIKNEAVKQTASFFVELISSLYSSGYLTASKAAGANVNVLNGTVEISLYSSDVGLPCSVRTSVGVRYLNTESHSFSANFTFSHLLHLLSAKIDTYIT